MPQIPLRAREKKQVTVGDSLLAPAPSLQPASASVMKPGGGGGSDFSFSSHSLLSTVQNRANGLSFNSYL